MEHKILELLEILGNIGKFDITIGVSEILPMECMFILKDKKLYNKVQQSVSTFKVSQTPDQYLENSDAIAGLLGKIGQNLNIVVNISFNEILDRDCLILFKNPTLVEYIYKRKI